MKQDLLDDLRRVFIPHITAVARSAELEQPGLRATFRLPPENRSYEAVRTAARVLVEQAQAGQELLTRHGLSAPLLAKMAKSLEEFEAAVEQSADGKRAHIGARSEFRAVVAEIAKAVDVLEGHNRFRFADDLERLGAWTAARNVVGPFQHGTEEPKPGPAPEVPEVRQAPQGGDEVVRPAA